MITGIGFVKNCRYCGAQIWFVPTVASRGAKKRRYQPLDPEVSDAGSIAVTALGDCRPVGVGHPDHEGELYEPHHATCEEYTDQQALFRRRRDIDD